tara:strand:- start:445 stop:711 length:267 start_codon:yes stop_codon:yes gene_type:complete
MLEILVKFLAAFAKTFTIAGALNLPLDNIRNYVYSSESVMILALFLFVVGETGHVLPALVVTVLYLYLEVVPRRLRIKDDFFEDYHKV